MTELETPLETQLRSLRRPTRPLDAGDFDEVRALGGTRDHRRVAWRLAAASVVVLALVGGAFALGRRTAPVDTLSPRPTRTFTLVADGPATIEQLDLSVPIVQQRLDNMGIDHATVERQGEAIVVTVPDSVAPSDLALVTMSNRVEFRGVLRSEASTQASAPREATGAGLPPGPAATLPSDEAIVLDDGTEQFTVGPAALTGGIERAMANRSPQSGRWIVNPVLLPGAAGLDPFNELAGRCYIKDATCPTGRLAIVVNGVVVSAPSINAPRFDRDQIQISGTFSEETAKSIAEQMGTGGLPVRLQVR